MQSCDLTHVSCRHIILGTILLEFKKALRGGRWTTLLEFH